MRLALLALLALPFALAACCDDDDDCDGCGGPSVPVFLEREPNDLPATANDFGTVRPGDDLIIEGSIRDDLSDPFDGFAFTAGEPLHVDFELFIDGAADLDVCLYDPQIDETVACFATDNDPERGGVDVFEGGLDFHLVIESFTGDAAYSLVLTVLPLFGREALGVEGGSVRGVGALSEHPSETRDGYAERAPEPRLVLEQVVEVDLERGLVIERRRMRGER
jgi:hypothetical protein